MDTDMKYNEAEYMLLVGLLYHIAGSMEGEHFTDERLRRCHEFAVKILLYGISGHTLAQGSSCKTPEGNLSVYDVPSILVIARAALETVGMFHHIFVETKSDPDLFNLRFAAWTLRGIRTRKRAVEPLDIEAVATLASDRQERLKQRVVLARSPAFHRLPRKVKKEAWKGKQWPPSHKMDFMAAAGFPGDLVKRTYGYLSDYVHAGGLAMLQLQQRSSLSPEDQELGLMVLKMAMARMIWLYAELFPQVKSAMISKSLHIEAADKWGYWGKD